jgi:hypothetical protein
MEGSVRKPLRTFGHLLAFPLSAIFLAAPAARADVTIRFNSDFKLGVQVPGMTPEGLNSATNPLPKTTSVQIKGDKEYSNSGLVSVLSNLGTDEVTLIDPAHKQFTTTYAKDYLAEITASLPTGASIPPAVQLFLDSMKMNFSSRKTGRTEMIQGVLVEESELTLTIEMPLPGALPGALPAPPPASGTNGQPTPRTSAQKGQPIPLMKIIANVWSPAQSEIERVPALAEWNKYKAASTAAVLGPLDGMQKVLSSVPGIGKTLSPMFEDLSKNSPLPLKLHLEVYAPFMAQLAPVLKAQGKLPPDFDPNGPLAKVDSEAVVLSSAPIDDSVFQVPSDYHATPLADLMKSISPRPNAPQPSTPRP